MPQHSSATPVKPEQVTATHEEMSEDTLLTVGEVAKSLRVDTTTVRRWITLGVLDAVILPHHGKRQAYRIRKSTLDHILQSSQLPH